jgi:hypothetical protein
LIYSVLHLIELVFKLLYILLLGSYVITPPRKPVIIDDPRPIGFRGVCLLLYTIAVLLRRWSMATSPSILVFLSFITHILAEPCPGDIAFDLLLVAFIWHLISLHLPGPPSPLLLLRASDTLPLSALFHRAITHAIRPAVLFFLPIFFASFYMLSLSLSDSFFQLFLISVDPLPTAPIETRTSFLTLCFIVFGLFSASLCILTVTTASQGFSTTNTVTPWDRFGVGIGMQARQSFYHAVHNYSSRYCFPPPFNLLSLVFVQVPATVVWILRRGVPWFNMPWFNRMKVEEVVWRMTVGPVAALFAGLWLWGINV